MSDFNDPTEPFSDAWMTQGDPGLQDCCSAKGVTAELFAYSPRGALTTLDESAYARAGIHWSCLSLALLHLTEQHNHSLVWVDCGGAGKHGDGQWLASNFGRPHLLAYDDYDPDFPPFFEMLADPLDENLQGFGTPTLTEVAKLLADHERRHGPAVVVLDNIAGARPYSFIAVRQLDITDPAIRDDARAATFTWRAHDLATFAATRPSTVTIVATHDGDPGREALMGVAPLPLPHPASGRVLTWSPSLIAPIKLE
jgi:hypothetical protein